MTAGMKVTIDAKKQADVDKWADYATARIGEGTVRTYKSHLISFFAWLEDKPFNKCNIEDNITYMVKNGYAKITVNNRLAAIKQFCKWYCPRHDTKDPSIDVPFFNRKETQPKKRRFLTSEEYAKILAIADKGIERDTIEFLANTGLRRAEYLTFHVNAINKKGTHFSIIGKGKKERKVPMNARVREIIVNNARKDGSLQCVSYWRDNADNLWCWCQSLARRAQVPAFGPHAFRHYFATQLIRNGIPLKLVSTILGHATVLITEQTYCHIDTGDTTGLTDCLCEQGKLP